MTKEKAIKLFGNRWGIELLPFLNSDQYLKIKTHLINRKNKRKIIIYPDLIDIYKSFKLTPLNNVKVVILGNEPFFSSLNKSNGLAYGVKEDFWYDPPISSVIIREELENDYNVLLLDFKYNLEHWAKQGVLLLNKSLTVEEDSPGSHTKIWKPFIKEVIKILNNHDNNIIWVFWCDNNTTQLYKQYITNNTHHIVESIAPSIFSKQHDFYGSKTFSKINKIIENINGVQETIKWY